jgi:hypothetical protein
MREGKKKEVREEREEKRKKEKRGKEGKEREREGKKRERTYPCALASFRVHIQRTKKNETKIIIN